ncbi:MAG TPA: hypothetical protein PLL77_16305 [Pyrinomonadaceae bacterium]|nr:hypothetical protein [Pyrinomonadaceae bacterium]
MKREWEEGRRQPIRTARVGHYATINAAGTIVIGRFTNEALGSPEAVKLMFDRLNMSIGVKCAHPREDNAYPVKPMGRHGGKQIRGAQAANQFGLRLPGTIRFIAPEIDEDGLLILDLRNTRSVKRAAYKTKA